MTVREVTEIGMPRPRNMRTDARRRVGRLPGY